MTDKDLRRLSKTDLLALLRDQEKELQDAQAQIADLNARLQDRSTHLAACGSIAEASLQLNRVFQAAQAAADQYLAEVKQKRDTADADAQQILEDARQKAAAQLQAADAAARQRAAQAHAESAAYWTALEAKLSAFYESHLGLEELLKASGSEIRLPQPEHK
jgi:F0F1-type ATP synthase membrane subunit b/b'